MGAAAWQVRSLHVYGWYFGVGVIDLGNIYAFVKLEVWLVNGL